MNHKELDLQLVFSARQCCTGVGGNLNCNYGRGGGGGGRSRPSLHAASRGCAQGLQDMIDSAGDDVQVAVWRFVVLCY
jgi:hypothetical protein